jgi:transcriptional regulator with XRE-family HTH domain
MLSKTIGSKLLELRKQKNWSQEQTADYLCISRSVYQRIETGEGYS